MPADSTSIQQVHIAPLPATTFEPPGHVSQIYADGITTVLVDSIAADTVEGRIPHFIPVDEADSLRNEALADSMSQARMPMIPSGLSEGIAPMGMPPTYVNSTPLAALLMGSLVLAAVNSSSVARALKTYRAEL